MSNPQHIPDPGFVLAPFAAHPKASRGRYFNEPDSPPRSCFQRDRDRIIHSTAFRRLKHKTQVFVYHEGDHYRTRLTHSIEVSQIARSLARALRLNEDLAEALALAHDLGHPPFGHSGETALQGAMDTLGGFDHNEQTFRVVTRLERRYAEFDGLNLTWECLEGLAKHNGPLEVGKIPPSVAHFDRDFGLDLPSYPSLEAQIAALADDIAYNNHDLDDGLRAGLFRLDDLKDVALVGPIIAEVSEHYPGLEEPRLIHETVRRVITRMVEDLVSETRRRLAASNAQTCDDIRSADVALASFSEEMRKVDRELKDFLFSHMYRHEKVQEMIDRAEATVNSLFGYFMERSEQLPEGWCQEAEGAGPERLARLVADYIAGMTDRFALIECDRLCRK